MTSTVGTPRGVNASAAPTQRRWMSVGRSSLHDARAAGAEAIAEALAAGQAVTDAGLLIVFCTPEHDPSEVIAAIAERASGVPIIGASASAGITAEGVSERAVVVTALGGPGLSIRTAARAGTSAAQRVAGHEVASEVSAAFGTTAQREHCVLLLLTDGTAPDQEEILHGAYEVLGASIPLVGGTASVHSAGQSTFLFHGSEVLREAVVGALIYSDGPLGIGVQHGWRNVGEPVIVTHSSHGVVHTLNDRPALDVYLDTYGAPPAAYTDPDVFNAYALTRPIGLRRRSGVEVRNVSNPANHAAHALTSVGDIPEGALIWLMEGDTDSVLDSTTRACRDALDALDGSSAIGLVAFDCVARSGVLEERGMLVEVERMSAEAGAIPIAGFYTYGEIARVRGINGFHHQTLVILAVG